MTKKETDIKLRELEGRLLALESVIRVDEMMNLKIGQIAFQKYVEELGGNPEGFQKHMSDVMNTMERFHGNVEKHGLPEQSTDPPKKVPKSVKKGMHVTDSGIMVN